MLTNNITEIGGASFYGCNGITEFTIPINVTKIGDSAFSNCFYMEVFNIEAKNLVDFTGNSHKTFNEMGIESKTNGCIHNPVGGCDSTPMTRSGIKSVTFAAQNPMLTWYYHTFHDMPGRFEMETVGDGFDVVLNVIDKIAKFQETNGFNGPQKK